MFYLSPIPKQFVDSCGNPLSGGSVEVFVHGGTAHSSVYMDAAGEALQENPFTLDSYGSWKAYVSGGVPYDYVVKDSNGNVIFSYENVVAGDSD